ncbi:MAG: hypothetical protein KGZ25_01005 [Planctomycetes bacterium]|nr:hypothetical protein [Planctomycetota bacterium]
MSLAFGIDAGSVAIKAIAVRDNRPIIWRKIRTGADVSSQCAGLLGKLRDDIPGEDVADSRICSTGYGRNLISAPQTIVSEILANAIGVGWMWRHWDRLEDADAGFGTKPDPSEVPGPFRTVIDIGGQDSKAITFSGGGIVDQFAMNERCAAGTGRFLEVMARVLEVDLRELDKLAQSVEAGVSITSTCTVFAESEVVSLLSEGCPQAKVAAGIVESIARRARELLERVGWSPPVMFDGGPSHLRSLRLALSRELNTQVAVPPCAEYTTALGAALYGRGLEKPTSGF